MYRSVVVVFERVVGVGFGVRRVYRTEDRWCEVSHNDPAGVPAGALGPYLPELRARGLIEPCT